MTVNPVVKHLWLCTVWASFLIMANVESLHTTQNYSRLSSLEKRKEVLSNGKKYLFQYVLHRSLNPTIPSINEDRTFGNNPNIQMLYGSAPKVEFSTIYNFPSHEIKKKMYNAKLKRDTYRRYKHPAFTEEPSGAEFTQQKQKSPYLEPLNSFGLSYLESEEGKYLSAEPIEPEEQSLTAHVNPPSKTYTRYLPDQTDFETFPRFNIPLRSLQLDAGQEPTYNFEASEIIEPTYIIPKNENNTVAKIKIPISSKTTTHGVSIRNGEFSRKEIRNDNGEYFSGYKDSTSSSADAGSLVATSDGGQVLVRRGSYSFTSPEGLRYRVDYTADETGYHATQIPVQ